MIELGQRIPASRELRGSPPVEKWILRRAFEDLLPREIVWREKEQFAEGSGTVDLLEEALRTTMRKKAAANYAAAHPTARLRCPEECYYHQIFMNVFKRPERRSGNVARWAERPMYPSPVPDTA